MAASSATSRAASRGQRRTGARKKTGPTSKRPPTKKREIRYGSEVPRIYTPPLRELTPQTSLGFSVIEFAETVMLLTLLPWQKWLLIHMLELLPDNTLRFRTVVVLVARQNGKSTLSQVIGLWFMYVYGIAMVLGTAQDLDTAEEVWEGAVNLAEEVDENDVPIRPELHDLVDKVVRVNGKKALVLKTKKRWKVKAANRRAGRGLSGDVIFLDELREHQSWDAWGSITKTTIARAFALILALSNAGDSTSIVLRHLRKLAHAALGDPDGIVAAEEDTYEAPTDEELDEFDDDAADLFDEFEDEDTLGIFEWSARPDRGVHDRDGWAEANPSLGYTIQERTLAAAAKTDPEWVFRTECMCQWPGGTLHGPFPPMLWENGRWEPERPDASVPPDWKIQGTVRACVVMSHDRKMTAVAVAGRRADGLPQVEIAALRAGSKWVKEWFRKRVPLPEQSEDEKATKRIVEVTGRKAGPEGELLKDLTEAGVPVTEWSGENLGNWTGAFYDLVVGERDEAGEPTGESGLRHLPQPALDVAAANAVTRPLGLRFVWDPDKSPVDICTLIAATGATALLMLAKPPAPPPPPPKRATSAARRRTGDVSTAGF